MQGALDGLRVLDLGRLLPGPYCTLVLADHGAEVIKVESPFEGDYVRKMGPMIDEDSAYFWQLNRNKKSLSLNLKTPEGVAIFRQLAEGSDVLVESFRPDVMDSLGLGYKDLAAINPRLIYCAISGYGQQGPFRHRAGHDINYIGLAGVLSLSASRKSPPVMPAVQLADVAGGSLWGLVAILLALQAREKTGRGQFLDISMMEGSLAFLPLQVAQLSAGGGIPRRGEGILSGHLACYNIYETGDGRCISLGALEPKFWQSFCRIVKKPHLVDKQNAPRETQEEVKKELAELFKKRTLQEWVELFSGEEDSCVEPVLELDEVADHPQVQERETFLDAPLKNGGFMKQIGFPCKLSSTPARYRKHPPALGEDTAALLQELGRSGVEIEELKDKGVI